MPSMRLAWLALSEKTRSSGRSRALSKPRFAAYPELKKRAASAPVNAANSSSNASQAGAGRAGVGFSPERLNNCRFQARFAGERQIVIGTKINAFDVIERAQLRSGFELFKFGSEPREGAPGGRVSHGSSPSDQDHGTEVHPRCRAGWAWSGVFRRKRWNWLQP